MKPNALTDLLVAEIRARGTPAETATRPAVAGPLPADLDALATALAETKGYFMVGQWELGIGGEAAARRMVDAIECDDVDRPIEARLLVLANNLGGLVTVVGLDPAATRSAVYKLDAEYGEIHAYGTLDDWLAELYYDDHERERDGGDGLLSALGPILDDDAS